VTKQFRQEDRSGHANSDKTFTCRRDAWEFSKIGTLYGVPKIVIVLKIHCIHAPISALAMRHRLCGLSTYGLNGLEREMSTPPTLRRGTAEFTLSFYLISVQNCSILQFL